MAIQLTPEQLARVAAIKAAYSTIQTDYLESSAPTSKLDSLERFAIAKLEEWNLSQVGWQFVWSNNVSKLGKCSYRRKSIYLSRLWAVQLPEHEAQDTILHEIAHALAPGDGHGRIWKQKCILVGANPSRLYDGDVKRSDIKTPLYQMIDTTTGKVVKSYYRRPSRQVFATIHNYYVKSRPEETRGKLIIVAVKPSDSLESL